MNEQQQVRQEIYGLLAHLFRIAPDQMVIDWLSTLEVEGNDNHAMSQAWVAVSKAAQESNQEALTDEYQNLFIGVGRGEVMPFGSWHIAGALMEKPLVALRQDLMQLGFERADDVKEPEDHISALCEVMAMLIEAGDAEVLQQRFFNRHIQPWYVSLCEQINNAENADFYKSVTGLVEAFFIVEQTRFAKNPNAIEVTEV
ncbi:molecular chaperone [Aliivibrio sp. S4TY2]|uniref:TorD/DmsD family molecular chaperone n=1 Tax=unclassified Aliivibrio TaxID=2645654 RepID=UPI002379D4A2|nr:MULTISPECIES: molecular chaperone [unclassified Aliivibrio]MDD9158440.1 molecular chaperone [Aliivibrio sp. S4TY2]MDD9162440.1 molecular chaperone [Aliivibrio sp. S4TY1]MDD9166447.1 molecular chaperone [Aliivibrio sp. S4MY2]MDD9170445.1 molecular chaperone [Aliivibrio sp. S4MY4]MDD9187525.1 molecular chaperone [Aliivibrio sp. S4MY3]